MTVLSIHSLPDAAQARLRERAALHGLSIEAEACAILTTYLADEDRPSAVALQDWVDSLYGANKPRRVVEELLAERRRENVRE
ncbi:MAG: hypothetical protein P9F19_11210 [Candidatus Contendobacter sp.]|nr:hypothetical protein [Candidatus Contendobacter sp.]MDG4557937.1 hypothetical protein [Candidatus Contendobacter sp.]